MDIQKLVDELEPVKPLDWRRGLVLPALLTVLSSATIISLGGIRADLAAGSPHPMFLLRGGLLLLLGVVCGSSLLAMARPGVGKAGNGWKIAVAAALLLPLAALIFAMSGQQHAAFQQSHSGLQCLTFSGVAGLATAVPMVFWLRKGAPVALERAGWLTGLSAGGLGAFSYGFHCPYNDIVYIGTWYSLAVALCAVTGRLLVPGLIRW